MPIQQYAEELRWVSFLGFTRGRTPKFRFELSRVFCVRVFSFSPHAGALET